MATSELPEPDDGAPIRIPPPTAVRIAAGLLLVGAAGLLVLAALVITARRDADLTWSLTTASYFVLLAGLVVAVAIGLLRGRRWARTPAIVLALITAFSGFYLAVPSAQPVPGAAVLAFGGALVALLVSRPATRWISSFPPLFGPGPDR